MNAHRGEPATVRIARLIRHALAWQLIPGAIGHDARTGGAFFRVTWLGHRYTIRVTEVDE